MERRISARNLLSLGSPELDRQQTFWRLTLEMGMAMERAYIDWLNQCEAVVRGSAPIVVIYLLWVFFDAVNRPFFNVAKMNAVAIKPTTPSRTSSALTPSPCPPRLPCAGSPQRPRHQQRLKEHAITP
jgi:hypothetical protein